MAFIARRTRAATFGAARRIRGRSRRSGRSRIGRRETVADAVQNGRRLRDQGLVSGLAGVKDQLDQQIGILESQSVDGGQLKPSATKHGPAAPSSRIENRFGQCVIASDRVQQVGDDSFEEVVGHRTRLMQQTVDYFDQTAEENILFVEAPDIGPFEREQVLDGRFQLLPNEVFGAEGERVDGGAAGPAAGEELKANDWASFEADQQVLSRRPVGVAAILTRFGGNAR